MATASHPASLLHLWVTLVAGYGCQTCHLGFVLRQMGFFWGQTKERVFGSAPVGQHSVILDWLRRECFSLPGGQKASSGEAGSCQVEDDSKDSKLEPSEHLINRELIPNTQKNKKKLSSTGESLLELKPVWSWYSTILFPWSISLSPDYLYEP